MSAKMIHSLQDALLFKHHSQIMSFLESSLQKVPSQKVPHLTSNTLFFRVSIETDNNNGYGEFTADNSKNAKYIYFTGKYISKEISFIKALAD